MKMKYFNLFTQVGLEKIAAAILSGEEVKVTQMAVGDGGGGYYEPTADMTGLRREVWRGDTTFEVDPADTTHLKAVMLLPGSVGGFVIREYAIFDEAGDMLAISNTADIAKAVAADGMSTEVRLVMNLFLTGDQAQVIRYDPTVIIATKEDVAAVDSKRLLHETDGVKHVSDAEKASWNAKVDRVAGMGLSANDYTTPEKTKLAGLSNYNDAALQGKVTANSQAITALQTGKAPTVHTHDDRYHTETEMSGLLAGKAPTVHTHDDRYHTETEMSTLLAGKAPTVHNHDDRYYTEAEMNGMLAGKAPAIHSHDGGYTKHFGTIPADIFNSACIGYSYTGDVTGLSTAPSTDWWHILYIPHTSYHGGYGAQIAIGFHGGVGMYVRTASGVAWGAWSPVYTPATITVSATAPTYFLGENIQWQVYG